MHGCNGTFLLQPCFITENANPMNKKSNKFIKSLAWHCVLCTTLFAPVLMAQGFPPTDREHRQGMSYEEYSAHREKMRLRMEIERDEDHVRSTDRQKPPADQTEKSRPDSAYGQGFHTRSRADDKQDRARTSRHDRPHFERTNRGDRGRR